MYRSAPLFIAYFEAIGAEVVLGETTSEHLWQRAAGRGTVDACFPVKAVHAHVADLLRRKHEFDVLFFPALTHAVTAVRGCADSASCPVVAGTPLVVRAAFEEDASIFLTPTLVLTNPRMFADQLYAAVVSIAPRLSREEHTIALDRARGAQRAFEARMEEDGRAVIARAERDRKAAIVLLARPYHADPGIHHDLGSELWAIGRTTLSIRALPKDGEAFDLGDIASELTNSGAAEKVAASRLVASHPWLVAIELSSFKCGQDASLYGTIGSIARAGSKPFLALHDFDETRPVASLRLRLRTFLDAVERWERA
jgi:predicted nucleotide-binding protein (sugar kinase/HSP70/actin superfamily)